MERLRYRRMKLIIGPAMIGLIAVVATGLLLRAEDGAALSSSEVNSSFSALQPASDIATSALPGRSKTRLLETDRGGLGGIAEEPLTAVASTETEAGPVLLAQFGRFICARSEVLELSNCGTVNLIEEGKLLTYTPGCPTTTVFGVLPDGIEAVEATAGGDSRTIPVLGNVYSAEIPTTDTVLSAESPEGKVFELVLPLGEMRRGCAT